MAIAANCPASQLMAVELDDTPFAVAQKNVDRHNLESRIKLVQGDLFEAVGNGPSFDIIVSNPPYVTDAEMETLPPDVRDHEPHLALRAGVDGLDIVRRIVAEADAYLEPGGALLLEIASEQAESVVDATRMVLLVRGDAG